MHSNTHRSLQILFHACVLTKYANILPRGIYPWKETGLFKIIWNLDNQMQFLSGYIYTANLTWVSCTFFHTVLHVKVFAVINSHLKEVLFTVLYMQNFFFRKLYYIVILIYMYICDVIFVILQLFCQSSNKLNWE